MGGCRGLEREPEFISSSFGGVRVQESKLISRLRYSGTMYLKQLHHSHEMSIS